MHVTPTGVYTKMGDPFKNDSLLPILIREKTWKYHSIRQFLTSYFQFRTLSSTRVLFFKEHLGFNIFNSALTILLTNRTWEVADLYSQPLIFLLFRQLRLHVLDLDKTPLSLIIAIWSLYYHLLWTAQITQRFTFFIQLHPLLAQPIFTVSCQNKNNKTLLINHVAHCILSSGLLTCTN